MARNIYTVSREWARRPMDQRFLTVDELVDNVMMRTLRAEEQVFRSLDGVEVLPAEENLTVRINDRVCDFTNWSFGQFARIIGAPAGYLQRLPSNIAADCMNFNLRLKRNEIIAPISPLDDADIDEPVKGMNVLMDMPTVDASGTSLAIPKIRAMCGPNYGRIRDWDVARRVQELVRQSGGVWQVPPSRNGLTRRSTTLYASDRDVFMFLCDQTNEIMVNGRRFWRGFYVSNSEVGSKVFNIARFLYDRVCENRIIWDVIGFQEIRMRHTKHAPERFLERVISDPAMLEGVNSEKHQALLTDGIAHAMNNRILDSLATRKDAEDVLINNGFTRPVSRAAVQRAIDEEGGFTTKWQLHCGLTAEARETPFQDVRIALERKAAEFLMNN